MFYIDDPQRDGNPVLTNNPVSGDTIMVWGHPGYRVSLRDDTIYDSTGAPIPTGILQAGTRCYLRCRLGLIHRVLMASILRRDLASHELVRHGDGNGLNNASGNLQIGTPLDNVLDRIETNTFGLKLKNQDVREIRELDRRGHPRRLIAHRYGVTTGHVSAIAARRVWRHLP